MRTELFIAWRYLFSKKGYNAINIVSGISAAAISVVAAAMICVMSVMNGFGGLIEDMFSQFDPQLRITSVRGKTIDSSNDTISQLASLPFVQAMTVSIEEKALVEYDGQQIPVQVKGVDLNFQQVTQIDSIIIDGYYALSDTNYYKLMLGVGLASVLNISARMHHGITLYAPKREGRVNMMRPDDSFRRSSGIVTGVFAVNQTKYDDRLVLVPLDMAHQLFGYERSIGTAVELRLTDNANLNSAQREIEQILGSGYKVENRYEQQADFFRMLKIEKLLTALLLIFIMLIAGFNIIGSLSMLIIDKQSNSKILLALGANIEMIRRIFLLEGWMISSIGAMIGVVIGLILCLIQQYFGIIKLGQSTDYIISAYPVKVQAIDIVATIFIVLLLGFICAWFPVSKIKYDEKD